ncbi:MAG: hypothetical protein LC123_02440 [Burkholderiales bacterium]|nr:hypothetical protein [Burkholderiales bacterium]
MHDMSQEIARHGLVPIVDGQGKTYATAEEALEAVRAGQAVFPSTDDAMIIPKKLSKSQASALVAALLAAGAEPPPEPRPRLRARVATLQAESATRREAREKHRQEVERVQQQLRLERERQRDEERARVAQERGAAFEADRALRDALKDVDGAFAIYETTRKEGASLIAEAEARAKAANDEVRRIERLLEEAEEARRRADIDAAMVCSMFDVESSRAAYDEAMTKAKAAAAQADRAWQATPKAFRKAHRDRALRKRARDLGLTSAPGEE